MDRKPIFFLTTVGEYEGLKDPRACFAISRLTDPNRDDYMLAEIDPPLSGQDFGLGGKDVTLLILATKLSGVSLFPKPKLPAHVYVARIRDESVLNTLKFTPEQVQLIAWGCLYSTLDEALSASRQKY